MMARALEEADVLFQQLSYPDENHGLVGLRPHFYHSLSNFILNDCFGRNEVFKKWFKCTYLIKNMRASVLYQMCVLISKTTK